MTKTYLIPSQLVFKSENWYHYAFLRLYTRVSARATRWHYV
jgi:hypothetical protein